VELAPGESKEVSVSVDPRLLATFDARSKTWRIANGAYKVLLARDAGGADAASVIVQLAQRTLDLHGKQIK
jgi:beta-glucosidase